MKLGWHRIYWMRWRWATVKRGIHNVKKTAARQGVKIHPNSQAVLRFMIEQEFDRAQHAFSLFKMASVERKWLLKERRIHVG